MKKGDYLKSIISGNIFIQPNFLEYKNYQILAKKIENLNFIKTYQPANEFYGNRFQAQPCWEFEGLENIDNFIYIEFIKKIENIIEKKIKNFKSVIRKTISNELLRSKVDTKYGLIHRDSVKQNNWCNLAGVFYFTQSVDGGTAFFEKENDKYPDIEIGAFPNRLIMYNSHRPHASCQDFTFEERYVLAFAIKYD